ncbi:MAG TPA: hypothetical protein VJ695_02865 [Nitrososphaera sp.]|nr:hypothetical protein [Nitrososphaera sp.]
MIAFFVNCNGFTKYKVAGMVDKEILYSYNYIRFLILEEDLIHLLEGITEKMLPHKKTICGNAIHS